MRRKHEVFEVVIFRSVVADFQARTLERSWNRSGDCERVIPQHIPDWEIAVGTASGADPQ